MYLCVRCIDLPLSVIFLLNFRPWLVERSRSLTSDHQPNITDVSYNLNTIQRGIAVYGCRVAISTNNIYIYYFPNGNLWLFCLYFQPRTKLNVVSDTIITVFVIFLHLYFVFLLITLHLEN